MFSISLKSCEVNELREEVVMHSGLPPVFNSTYFVYFSLVVVRKRFVC